MFSLRVLSVLLVIQVTVATPCCTHEDWDSHYDTDTSYDEESSDFPDLCLDEDDSIISSHDIVYSIEDIAQKLQIEEKLMNIVYEETSILRDKYLEKLEQFYEKLVDRPKHLFHILEDIAERRRQLEPEVFKIGSQLQEFDVLEEMYNEIAESSEMQLIQFEKYKKICQINCGLPDFETRFMPEIIYGRTCLKLKDLHEYINGRLQRFLDKISGLLHTQNSIQDDALAKNLTDLKMNLKKAAVKQFGVTMYDILSLQDDYYHFAEDLQNFEISSELHNIEENSAEIKLKMIGLKRDLEKYRQYCTSCSNKRRMTRDIFFPDEVYSEEPQSDEPFFFEIYDSNEEDYENGTNIVDTLINNKILKLMKAIESHFLGFFTELEKDLNDPEIVELYAAYLQPIQDEIENNINIEQESLNKLKSSIPESSVERVLKLSEKSEQMVHNLDALKEFINKYI